jgi:hypothetical protein
MRFKATVASAGTRAYVVIPFDPDETWGRKDRHYITGSVNGCPVRGLLESSGTQFFLFLGPAWRRDSGVEPGADVEVVLAPEGPQSGALSPDVTAALDAEPDARAFFDALATFYRKNYIRWIESAKRAQTRTARIAEMVRLLKAGRKQR